MEILLKVSQKIIPRVRPLIHTEILTEVFSVMFAPIFFFYILLQEFQNHSNTHDFFLVGHPGNFSEIFFNEIVREVFQKDFRIFFKVLPTIFLEILRIILTKASRVFSRRVVRILLEVLFEILNSTISSEKIFLVFF